MVGFGLEYACAHIIIPASVNLLPIQADFVTERDTRDVGTSASLFLTAVIEAYITHTSPAPGPAPGSLSS